MAVWVLDNAGLDAFVDEHKDDHTMLDFAIIHISAHNVYYVKFSPSSI